MRLILLALLLAACRPEPSPKHAPITQLPKRNPITPSTQADQVEPISAPAQMLLDAGVMTVREMMTPAADRAARRGAFDQQAVVAPPADAGPDAIVQLPPVPDAQSPLDARGPVPEMPRAPPSGR